MNLSIKRPEGFPEFSVYATAYSLLIVATNVIVTGLITFHLLRARQTLSILPSKHIRVYTGIVAILIESALPPAILGIITGVFLLVLGGHSTNPSDGSLVCDRLFSGLFYSFCVSFESRPISKNTKLIPLYSDHLTPHYHLPCHNWSLLHSLSFQGSCPSQSHRVRSPSGGTVFSPIVPRPRVWTKPRL